MARIRKFAAYRSLERPYTRVSKFKKKAFIRIMPNPKVIAYETGKKNKKFPFTVILKSKNSLQIRDNALESSRQSCNKLMEKNIGVANYHLKLKPYPHHVLRENPVASGAGADRFSTGMKKSFGKPIGVAAQIKVGQIIYELSVNKTDVELAKRALKRASMKLPTSCSVEIIEN